MIYRNETRENMSKAVRFDKSQYEWAEVEGRGRCLVPLPPRPIALEKDIWSGRRFRNLSGAEQMVLSIYPPGGGRVFWTVTYCGSLPYGYCGEASFFCARDLAKMLNADGPESATAFNGWVS